MPPTKKNLLTEEEAAAYLGLSPRTLQRRRVSRIDCPPFVKVGSAPKSPVRYDEADLASWVEARKVVS